MPPETRAARTAEFKEIADFAKVLGCQVVALHIGFVPHDRQAPLYKQFVDTARDVCDHVAKNGQALHLETGQETADDLLQFIQDVQRPNLFINFDPANMILYGAGDPIEAIGILGRHIRHVHVKDATLSASPGAVWGTEVPFGTGEVPPLEFLRALHDAGYTGPLAIEREAGETRMQDIAYAIETLRKAAAEADAS